MPPVFGPVSPSPNPLVILRRRQWRDMLSIGQHQKESSSPVKELFDHDRVLGHAQQLSAEEPEIASLPPACSRRRSRLCRRPDRPP